MALRAIPDHPESPLGSHLHFVFCVLPPSDFQSGTQRVCDWTDAPSGTGQVCGHPDARRTLFPREMQTSRRTLSTLTLKPASIHGGNSASVNATLSDLGASAFFKQTTVESPVASKAVNRHKSNATFSWHVGRGGEIGRRTRLRIWRRKA